MTNIDHTTVGGHIIADESLVGDGGNIMDKSREVWLKDEVYDKVCDTHQGIRMVVGLYYLQVLNSPPQSEWDGKYSTVAHVCKV